MAFDSPNIDLFVTIGISIDENEYLVLSPAKRALRLHTRMATRILTVRLVPGFNDAGSLLKAAKKRGNYVL
jgi:hypothetical protein